MHVCMQTPVRVNGAVSARDNMSGAEMLAAMLMLVGLQVLMRVGP